MERNTAGLVSGRAGIQSAVAGADGRKTGGAPRWGVETRERGSQRRADSGGGIAAVGLEGLEQGAQERPGQT